MIKLSSERKHRILEKLAEEESRILKALPGIGAIAGGLYGAKNPTVVFSALKGRLPSAIAGAGTGAGIGYIPSALRDLVKAFRRKKKKKKKD